MHEHMGLGQLRQNFRVTGQMAEEPHAGGYPRPRRRLLQLALERPLVDDP